MSVAGKKEGAVSRPTRAVPIFSPGKVKSVYCVDCNRDPSRPELLDILWFKNVWNGQILLVSFSFRSVLVLLLKR